MKSYQVVLEKHAPFRESQDGQKIIHSQFFVQLRMCCIQLGSHSFLTAMAKILQNSWIFCILKVSYVLL